MSDATELERLESQTKPEQISSLHNKPSLFERLTLPLALLAWYTFGVCAIVTTKKQLQDWNVPALVLTLQQMVLGSLLVRLIILCKDGSLQPWPFSKEPLRRHSNFLLIGIFNCLDFCFSNLGFAGAAAHFVETIKASDPITTTLIAVIGKVDALTQSEGVSLIILVVGVLLSTWGNSSPSTPVSDDHASRLLWDSLYSASLVTTANFCFGFRALHQKKYRSKNCLQVDNWNLFLQMLLIGATFLSVPVILLYGRYLPGAWEWSLADKHAYGLLALINSVSYVTYNLASTFVLSRLTVLQHSSLNCLRRMILIVMTALYFGKLLSLESIVGLCTSFFGFACFTCYRSKKTLGPPTKDSNV